MEVGMIPRIDQYKENKNIEMQQVRSTADSASINNKKDLEQVQQEAISKGKKNEAVEQIKVDPSKVAAKYESLISNIDFGYNKESRDFYVKVERGNIENQYPTEEMMRVKAYVISMQEATLSKDS
ncbi:hypothetical protein [Aliarcobacter cibarius]|jgi:uncharacterized FlaG/YvyC family protein|uniref:FlaG family protein n=1 Tax=Aliarcobacter cibarius TaxID=255507 RepID=A0A5J6RF64_9BACT|nr:hypothetical protein [Aliarcobacter cibarius]QEZ88909.1 FlaG family protein [Aliarcobacter cibarius]QKJ26953.1 FlaG family protein [Aliarcobacter cibarius]TLS97769.1 hypothetical protein FE247_08075 [Aliarcobacter cibarius]TLS98531.1 hypothetical protein FE245_07860 [Aliarcobacter cibarius]TLT03033.1 hypothetical protein FE248_08245 [Aliarcobacter cibarius]